MSTLHVAAIQLAYGDEEAIPERIERVAGMVRAEAGNDLVVLPELWSAGGFDYRHWEERSQEVPAPGPLKATGRPELAVAEAMSAAAQQAGVTLHAGSVVERSPVPGPEGKHLWNTSMVFAPDGSLLTSYRKVHRFGFSAGEPSLMEAGAELNTLALGDFTAHLTTCFDLRFPEFYRSGVDAGADLLVIPSAWPMARREHWRVLLRARAIENQVVVIGCNTAGTHAKRHEMAGASAILDARGKVLAEAGDGEEVLHAELDPDEVAEYREEFPVLADRRWQG